MEVWLVPGIQPVKRFKTYFHVTSSYFTLAARRENLLYISFWVLDPPRAFKTVPQLLELRDVRTKY